MLSKRERVAYALVRVIGAWHIALPHCLLVMVSFLGEGLFFLEKGPSKIILLLYFLGIH